MDVALMSAEESTAVPTPASSDCSSAFSHPGVTAAASQWARGKPLRQLPNEHETSWGRMSKDTVQPMAEDMEYLRKRTAPVNAVGIGSSTTARPSPKAGEEVEKRSAIPGQSSTRSRSQGKSTGSRSQPRTPVQGRGFSPVRTGSPGAEQRAEVARNSRTRGGISTTLSTTLSRSLSASALSSRNALLEKELKDSQHARAELEQKLVEERGRAMADREQLAKLLMRIEQLESSREVNAALLEDNRFLRSELEAEKLQVQEVHKQLERVQGETPPTVVLSTAHQQLLQENAKLRGDLQQSQSMLAKYTEELQTIMPDVEMILNQWKGDSHLKGPDGAVAPLHRPAETGVDATRLDARGASSAHASSTGGGRDLPATAGSPQAAVHSGEEAAETDLRERQLSALAAAARSYQHAASASKSQQRPKSPVTRAGGSQGATRASGSGSRPRSAGRGTAAAASARSSTSPQPRPRPVPAQLRSGTGRQGSFR